MHRVPVAAFVASLFVSLLAGRASADALDDAHLLVGLEHVTGLAFTHVETTANGKTTTESYTDGSLLWTLNGASPRALPRFAFDGVIGGHLTLGGAIGYGVESGTRDDPTGTSNGSSTTKLFAVSPRIGVLYALAPSVYLWPRVGMTHFTVNQESDVHTPAGGTYTKHIDGTSIDLDPALAIFPAPHVGVLLQAIFALPVAGTQSESVSSPTTTFNTPDADSRWRTMGVSLGVVAAF